MGAAGSVIRKFSSRKATIVEAGPGFQSVHEAPRPSGNTVSHFESEGSGLTIGHAESELGPLFVPQKNTLQDDLLSVCSDAPSQGSNRSTLFREKGQHRLSETALPVDDLLNHGLDSFGFQHQEMCLFYSQIVQFLGCQAVFKVPTQVILKYVTCAKDHYRLVPYHNFTHAFSITQFLFATCTKSQKIAGLLGDCEMLALFSAAPVHDIDHPGNNNAWEVATRSELAIRYNDTSVLENHHAAIGLKIMEDSQSNMFDTLPSEQAEIVRDLFVYAILQTDMAQHFKMVDRLKEFNAAESAPPFSCHSAEDRRYLSGVLLHAVDISNPLLPSFELSRKWAERINEEFVNQYKLELKAGLPETKMWAALDSNVGFYKSQFGFIDFIVAPLWIVLTDLFEDLEEDASLRIYMAANQSHWQRLADQELDKTTSGVLALQRRFRRQQTHRLSETTLPVDHLLDYGLNSFCIRESEMIGFYLQIFQFVGCQTAYRVNSLTVRRFMAEVTSHYKMVPYHNLTHAFSITQFLFAIFFKTKAISSVLGDLEILAIFTAAPVHDIEHPGNNNAWEVATTSELAVRYNDIAVLENHHAATGLSLMEDSDSNVFGTLTSDQLRLVKETFVYTILQTDMAQHFKMVDRLKELKEQEQFFSRDSLEDRRYLAGTLLHAVDISNPLLPDFELSRKWSERINEEFLYQYKMEVKAGLPETKMWANLDSSVGFFKGQLGFIDFIVSPLWTVLSDMFKDTELIDNLARNRAEWEALADEEAQMCL